MLRRRRSRQLSSGSPRRRCCAVRLRGGRRGAAPAPWPCAGSARGARTFAKPHATGMWFTARSKIARRRSNSPPRARRGAFDGGGSSLWSAIPPAGGTGAGVVACSSCPVAQPARTAAGWAGGGLENGWFLIDWLKRTKSRWHNDASDFSLLPAGFSPGGGVCVCACRLFCAAQVYGSASVSNASNALCSIAEISRSASGEAFSHNSASSSICSDSVPATSSGSR